MRRIGVLMSSAADDLDSQSRLTAFLDAVSDWVGPTVPTCRSKLARERGILTRCVATRRTEPALSPDAILAGVGSRSTIAPSTR